MRAGFAVVVCGLLGLVGCGGGSTSGSKQTLPPVADAGGPYTGTAGTAVTLSGAGSSDPQGQTLTYAWNFGDSATGTGVSPSHTYASAGTYTVSLTVTDTSNLSGAATSKATIAAAPLPPTANAGGPYTGTAGTAVNFSGAGSSDPQGQALTYAWSFGDSSTGAGVSPSHTYATAGTYTVSLTVTDTSGLIGSATSQATIAPAPLPGAPLTGLVTSGSQPVVGAHVYLLAAGTVGYGGAGLAASGSNASVSVARAALTGAADAVGAYVVTGSNGGFSLTGDYNCTSGQQLYLYALGGNAGSGTNSAIGMMAVVGSCPSSSSAAITVTVNEVSTIAAAYAIEGFATDATHVGSTGTALALTGITNAFANAGNLATLGTGVGARDDSGGERGGAAGGDQYIGESASWVRERFRSNGGGMHEFFANALSGGTTGAAATDTATAAINIAHHPAANHSALSALAALAPVFSPTNSALFQGSPNDFTVTIVFSGGGLGNGAAAAVDSSGNVWIPNLFSPVLGQAGTTVVEVSSSGSFLSGANGYSGGGLQGPTGVAIDILGNAWVTNQGGNSVTEISGTGLFVSGVSGYTGGGLQTPWGDAIDGSGNVWIANYSGSSVSEIADSGSPMSSSAYSGGGIDVPQYLAIDGTGNIWVANTVNGTVTKLSSTGSILSGANGYSLLVTPNGIAIDNSGTVWITSLNSGNLTKVSNGGAVSTQFVSSLYAPDGVAVDGAGAIWISSSGTYSLFAITNSGAPLLTYSGYNGTGGYISANGIAIDGSGDVWLRGNRSLFEFVGVATPVVTPLAVGVKNNVLGTRP